MVGIKKSVAKKKENVKGRTLHDILHVAKKGKRLHDIVHEGQRRRKVPTLLCYSKFTHSCGVSERRGVKRERQVMPPLVLLIKFLKQVSLLIYWSPIGDFCQNFGHQMFCTRHGDQNGRSLERCRLMYAMLVH